jgi:hypothetical protein
MRTGITPGQSSDDTGNDMVMAGNLLQPAALVADSGYGSDKTWEAVESRLFNSMLVFDDVLFQNETNIGILPGSLVSGVAGFAILSLAKRERLPGQA